MVRFDYIQTYMEQGGDNAKKLVGCIADYTKQSYNENVKVGTFPSVVTKYDSITKAEEIQKLYISEVERRSQRSLASVDGNLEMYAGFEDVSKMGAFITSIMIDTAYSIYLNQSGLAQIAEFHTVGYNGSAQFDVKDHSLYSVSRMGQRQKHTRKQNKKANTILVGTEFKGLTTGVTLPQIMRNEVMIADETLRMAMSISHDVYKSVIEAFIAAAETVTDAKYKLDSYTEGTFLEKLRNASAINGSKMVIVGDAVALKDLLPQTANYRVMLNDSFNTSIGYMDKWNTYDVLGFDVVADDDSATGVLGLPMDRLFGIPNDGSKLIHVAVGSTRSNVDGVYDNNNLSILTTLGKEIGVKLATTRKIVRCDLAVI